MNWELWARTEMGENARLRREKKALLHKVKRRDRRIEKLYQRLREEMRQR